MIGAELRPILRQLWSRVLNTAVRGRVTGVHDSGQAQALQLVLLAGEVTDGIEHVQPYGLSARPRKGAEAVVLCPGGARDAALAILVGDRRYRLQGLAGGEVALHDDNGNRVHIKAQGTIEVVAALKVKLSTPLVEVEGDLTVDGDVVATGAVEDGEGSLTNSMQDMRVVYNGHSHTGSGQPPGAQM